MRYTKDDLLRLAGRINNPKRAYLLVDPLQGKHMPVSPTRALAMMRALGEKMSRVEPRVDLVIGFAETATAVAGASAAALGNPCRYIHTTREGFIGGDAAEFLEEHSHAVEQRLCLSQLTGWIDEASALAFVDDELTTGKTLLNVIDRLAQTCPSIVDKPLVAASVISRLSAEREAEMAHMGVRCVSLLKLPPEDYTDAVRGWDIQAAEAPKGPMGRVSTIENAPSTWDARVGVELSAWLDQLEGCAAKNIEAVRDRLVDRSVTVLGTEEYMLPGLILARRLESSGLARRVRFHATTRSPIGIHRAEDYPIRSGWRLRSFYDSRRTTFIYDLQPADIALVLTDSPEDAAIAPALQDLSSALGEAGCSETILIREACHVQHL